MFISKKLKISLLLLAIAICLYASLSLINYFVMPPKSFPTPYQITIDSGQSLFSISNELYKDGAIRSKRVFEMLMLSFGSDKTISRGEYYFEKPANVVTLAMRISGRDFGVDKARVTFPEGFTNKQMADRLDKELSNFDSELFLSLAKDSEGYLFPDTYHLLPWATPESVIETLKKNFDKKISGLEKDLSYSDKSLKDIVIMASLIEKEARGEEDRYMISGILWKRISKGIPLQVDAPFLYILGKESKELTRTDLAINSPFNTYKYKGLPPAPIGNPGLESIKASLNPKDSPYLYYLHDSDGKIYYAKTYTEHQKNIRNYLK